MTTNSTQPRSFSPSTWWTEERVPTTCTAPYPFCWPLSTPRSRGLPCRQHRFHRRGFSRYRPAPGGNRVATGWRPGGCDRRQPNDGCDGTRRVTMTHHLSQGRSASMDTRSAPPNELGRRPLCDGEAPRKRNCRPAARGRRVSAKVTSSLACTFKLAGSRSAAFPRYLWFIRPNDYAARPSCRCLDSVFLLCR